MRFEKEDRFEVRRKDEPHGDSRHLASRLQGLTIEEALLFLDSGDE